MKFDFYLELASRAMDSRLLNLLRFPLQSTPVADLSEISGRWWEHGKTRRMKSRNREKIIERLSSTGINQLELRWQTQPSIRTAGLSLIEACLDFFPSPMSQLWAEVPIHQLKSHSEEVARRNLRMRESVLTREHRLPYPSTLECFLEMQTPADELSDSQLQKTAVTWLRSVMPPDLARQQIFGYGCIHGNCRRMGFIQSLGFPEIDELGEKFENVYPILIGPHKTCEAVISKLGNFAAATKLSDDSPCSVLSIDPERIKSVVDSGIMQKWLVPRTKIKNGQQPRAIVLPPQT